MIPAFSASFSRVLAVGGCSACSPGAKFLTSPGDLASDPGAKLEAPHSVLKGYTG
jgi:hypothetical protein